MKQKKTGANQVEILSKFKKAINKWWFITEEHRDYILCKEIYKCSPKDIEDVPARILDLHYKFHQLEIKEEFIKSKREQQSMSLKSKK